MNPHPTRSGSFFWTDEEVELLLRVTLDYKAAKHKDNVDWESVHTKYHDICQSFLKLYPTDLERRKEFPHSEKSIFQSQVTSKLKGIRAKYRKALDSGRRSGHGRVVMIYYDLCGQIWGSSSGTHTAEAGVDTAEIPGSSDGAETPCSRCGTPLSSCSEALRSENTQEPVSIELASPVIKTRRDMLQAKLNRYRRDRLKKRVHPDQAVQEDLLLKRRMLDLLEESERRNNERLEKITESIASISSSIKEGFSLLRQIMSQPQQQYPHPNGSSSMNTHIQGPPSASEHTHQASTTDGSLKLSLHPKVCLIQPKSEPEEHDILPGHVKVELETPTADPQVSEGD